MGAATARGRLDFRAAVSRRPGSRPRTLRSDAACGKPGRYDYVGILAITARTCAPDHTPPRGAVIPRSFNSFAIERSEFAPAVRISSMTGARSAARAVAARDLACRAFAQSLETRFGWHFPIFTLRSTMNLPAGLRVRFDCPGHHFELLTAADHEEGIFAVPGDRSDRPRFDRPK